MIVYLSSLNWRTSFNAVSCTIIVPSMLMTNFNNGQKGACRCQNPFTQISGGMKMDSGHDNVDENTH